LRLTQAPRLAGRGRIGSKQFFFEKKNQKTFDYFRLALPRRAHLYPEVFVSFSKRSAFMLQAGSFKGS
jgi:hypothetical protein